MNYSLPVSFVHGILLARILESVAMPSRRGFSQSGIKLLIRFPALAGRFFTISANVTSSMLFRTVSNLVTETRKKQERLIKIH